MFYRMLLGLVGLPASSMLTLVLLSTQATATTPASCDAPAPKSHRANLLNKATVFEDVNADFSEAESDAAVALFGCDCPSCIGALRQLQAQRLNENSQGHCWRSMEQRVSPEEAAAILQTLDAEDTKTGAEEK
jgi:hypothetical protein